MIHRGNMSFLIYLYVILYQILLIKEQHSTINIQTILDKKSILTKKNTQIVTFFLFKNKCQTSGTLAGIANNLNQIAKHLNEGLKSHKMQALVMIERIKKMMNDSKSW